jgi:excisionase family DNA binding protein
VPDRRHPDRQAPRLQGRRATDPTLTTRDLADRLGVSTAFILGEIRDGRLSALTLSGRGKRTIYRVSEAAFEAYVARYWTRRQGA